MQFTTLVATLFLFSVVSALESPLENGVYDYHRRVGMPLAQKIRAYENELAKNPERVVGGGTTTIAATPYQAGLIITFLWVFNSVCGGTIISDTRILTAAHCHTDGANTAQSMTVVLGSSLLFSGGTRFDTNDVVLNPGYNPNIVANDLAVLRTQRITFSIFIQPIALPSGSELGMDFNNFQATITGYGITRDGDSVSLFQGLSSVTVPVITNNVCASMYGGNFIQNHHLCTNGAGGRGACAGDTGGPLVVTNNWRRVLIGISSFVATAGCQAGMPSGFSRITSFVSWINSI